MNAALPALKHTLAFLRLDGVARRTYYSLITAASEAVDIVFRNPCFRLRGAPDGLPIPPSRLIYLVIGQYSARRFYELGLQGAESISAVLATNGLDISAFEAILDFGCGCGRVLRHWKEFPRPRLYGSDYNPSLINWCRKALTFAEFHLNTSASRLDYNDEMFDFVYALSVFTHLDEQAQRFWIRELTRVVKPGGYLLISIQGITRLRLHGASSNERQRFEAGELLVVNAESSGTNDCYTFHPEKYIRETLCQGLSVVDFVPAGQRENNQDVVLLRRPSTA